MNWSKNFYLTTNSTGREQANTAPLCGIFDVPELHRDNAADSRGRPLLIDVSRLKTK